MSLVLPLTTMEEFLFWEDRPAYPWCCFVRMRFAGQLERTALEAALRTTLQRHPLLSSIVQKRGRKRLVWVAVTNPEPRIEWQSGPTGGHFPPASHLDLQQEIGCRFHVVVDDQASDLVIQFHHACCDAAGMFVFFHDLLLAYALAQGANPERVRLLPIDQQLLAGRGRYGLTLGQLLRMLPKQLVGLQGVRQFLMRTPCPVIPHQVCDNEVPPPAEYPAVLGRVFDIQDTVALQTAAVQLGVTANDLLIRDLFLALAEWRTRQQVPADDGWLRMMIPMNLRTAQDRELPAANVVSSVFLDRRGPDFSDPERLLRSIHDEMELIKRNQLGYTFVFSTQLIRLLPGGLRKQVRADKCTVSCVFANLGKLTARTSLPRRGGCVVAGNVSLRELDLVTPIRPYACVALNAAIYTRKLFISLHYDPRPLTAAQAVDLLDTFERRIRASLATVKERGLSAAGEDPEE
ncbi:MAG: chromosome condensation protein [Planctomycetota bacterium]|nr:chromosome condensation protein [Planctomycetota bacterium]